MCTAAASRTTRSAAPSKPPRSPARRRQPGHTTPSPGPDRVPERFRLSQGPVRYQEAPSPETETRAPLWRAQPHAAPIDLIIRHHSRDGALRQQRGRDCGGLWEISLQAGAICTLTRPFRGPDVRSLVSSGGPLPSDEQPFRPRTSKVWKWRVAERHDREFLTPSGRSLRQSWMSAYRHVPVIRRTEFPI